MFCSVCDLAFNSFYDLGGLVVVTVDFALDKKTNTQNDLFLLGFSLIEKICPGKYCHHFLYIK